MLGALCRAEGSERGFFGSEKGIELTYRLHIPHPEIVQRAVD